MPNPKLFLISMAAVAIAAFVSCKKDDPAEPEIVTPVPAADCTPATSFTATGSGPRLIFKFKFDSTQVRLNNIGNPATVPAGNGAQSPQFNAMSQHYIELAGDFDLLGGGEVLYVGEETSVGGVNAINYCASTVTGNNEIFFSKPLSEINPGTYKWLRVSLAYQNYDIIYKANAIPGSSHLGTGTVASFIGFRTYINNYDINGHTYAPTSGAGGTGNHNQGYWGFETNVSGFSFFLDGQAPAGATTVPNPLFSTSPIPAGSCVVTGQFVNDGMSNSPLVITGSESSDIVITVSLSTNKSFEWHEVTSDDRYQPEIGEYVVDMGIRGLIPIKQ